MLLTAILVLGLAVFGAFKAGLIEPSAVQPVLITGYLAFIAGTTSYYFLVRHYFRKFYRADGRAGTWDFLFDDAGIHYKSETVEARLAWRAMDSVEDLGQVVLFHFGAQAIGIPPRIFSDKAARNAFVEAASARIKAVTGKS